MVNVMDFLGFNSIKSATLGDHKELHVPTGKFLRYAIFGLNDGLVGTVALVAGLVGAGVGVDIILIAGFAAMLSGGISMSLGTYVSIKNQIEFYKREVKKERENMERLPTVDENHIREVYREKGFVGGELDKAVDRIASNKKIWLDVLITEELGLSSSKIENPFVSGVVIFFAFIFGCFITLSSFMFVPGRLALNTAVVSSLAVLFLVGAGKTHFTGRNWIKSGIEMIIVGTLITFVAYYAGQFVSSFVSYFV